MCRFVPRLLRAVSWSLLLAGAAGSAGAHDLTVDAVLAEYLQEQRPFWEEGFFEQPDPFIMPTLNEAQSCILYTFLVMQDPMMNRAESWSAFCYERGLYYQPMSAVIEAAYDAFDGQYQLQLTRRGR